MYAIRSVEQNTSPIKLNDIFDKIYIIVLPSRKENALNALKSFDVQPEIVDAILKKELEVIPSVRKMLIAKKIISPAYIYTNIGTVACALSHIKTLKTFLKSDEKNKTAVIFEDDLQFCKGKLIYDKRIQNLSQELQNISGWDILFLGSCWCNCAQMNFLTTQICEGGNPLCGHAYVVTRDGAKKILQYALPMTNHIDNTIKLLGQMGILDTISITPPLFFQNRKKIGSTIGNNTDLMYCVENMNYDFSVQISVIILCHQELKQLTASSVRCKFKNQGINLDQQSLNGQEKNYKNNRKNIKNIIDKLQYYLEIGEIIVAHENFINYKFKNVSNIICDKKDIYTFFADTKVSNNIAMVILNSTNIPSQSKLQNMIKQIETNPRKQFFLDNKNIMITHK